MKHKRRRASDELDENEEEFDIIDADVVEFDALDDDDDLIDSQEFNDESEEERDRFCVDDEELIREW